MRKPGYVGAMRETRAVDAHPEAQREARARDKGVGMYRETRVPDRHHGIMPKRLISALLADGQGDRQISSDARDFCNVGPFLYPGRDSRIDGSAVFEGEFGEDDVSGCGERFAPDYVADFTGKLWEEGEGREVVAALDVEFLVWVGEVREELEGLERHCERR